MKISVLTPTIRPKGLEITQECLKQQTCKDFEWLIEVGYGKHDLNAAYNRMLKRAQGELIVSVQDYIKFPPDYLEKMWKAYKENPDCFITTPVGKVRRLNFSTKGVATKWDWRAYRNSDSETIRDIEWNCWEIDSGGAPLTALKQIGGFDEALDGVWSGDNVNVGKRAQLAGYKFKCLFDNPVLAYDHDEFIVHPFRDTFDGRLNTKRMAMFEGGMKILPLL